MNKYSLFLFDVVKQRKTAYFLKTFNALKHSSREEVTLYQFNKLKKLLFHAAENVPFYKQRFKETGFSPADLSSIDQIGRIPPLTRKDLQTHWKDIIAIGADINKLSRGSSSGSSGLPVSYYQDDMAISAGQAAHLLGWSLSGWEMRMKGLHIWGNPSTVNNEWKRLSSRIKARLFGHHKFPAYQLVDGQKFYELYERIKNNRYEFLDGYTNAIYLFADFLKREDLRLTHTIKYVLTTAENLQTHQRQVIEETIAPVYDEYGCSEIMGIAYECGQCGHYHVIDPHVYVEFGEKMDETGSRELLITDLDNYAFPLIRYKNDDLGIPISDENNDCLVKFSRIEAISGRQSDIIRLPDGGSLSVPSFFGSMLLKQINGLRQYQIERIREDQIVVRLVTASHFSAKDKIIVESAIKEYLDGRIGYQIQYVERIEPASTGKFKLLVDKTKTIDETPS